MDRPQRWADVNCTRVRHRTLLSYKIRLHSAQLEQNRVAALVTGFAPWLKMSRNAFVTSGQCLEHE
eukprot:scaffold365456_cov18-Prasinocladus_malaysianus.AAC.1